MINNKPKKSVRPGASLQWGPVRLLMLFAVLVAWLLPGYLLGQTEPSALFEIQSTDKGFLLPRMTEAQRDAIQLPAMGLMIYNKTSACVDINSGSPAAPLWQVVGCKQINISELNCDNPIVTGTLTAGIAVSGASVQVFYTGGNGSPHSGQTATSNGVLGLTASLAAGSFNTGAGSLTYTISGTPATAGTAAFELTIGGQSCTLTISVAGGTIGSLVCVGTNQSGTLTAGVPASGMSFQVPYTDGDGGTHGGQMMSSSGVSGLTATLAAGTFATGAGSLTFTVSGTPATSGTAVFALDISGQSCTLSVPVASGSIGSLSCGSANQTGVLTAGAPTTGMSLQIPYTGGNGGMHSGQTVSAAGVSGLTAMLSPGSFSFGSGSLTYTVSGTPASAGTATFALNIGGQNCTLPVTVGSGGGTGSGSTLSFNCSGASSSGTLVSGAAASGVSVNLPYTGGDGSAHGGQTANSTGVTGLTATLPAGSFATGTGNLTYTISGTPASAGTASFVLSIGGQSCAVSIPVESGMIGALNCANGVPSASLVSGVAANGVSVQVPYTGGNGGSHNGQSVSSTGVSGLTATLLPGNFASGAGSLTYSISGTPTGVGTALFALNIGGKSCVLSVQVESGMIASFCTNSIITGNLIAGVQAIEALFVSYTGGNGGPYIGETVGVTYGGYLLLASRPGGNLNTGSGWVTYLVSGIPGLVDNVVFPLELAGETCYLLIPVDSGMVLFLDCANFNLSSTLVSGVELPLGVTVTIPYIGGNGGLHHGQTVMSTGATGLTATLPAGQFAAGAGSVTLQLSGTPVTAPDTSGTASFALNIGGQVCTLNLPVIGGRISTLACADAVESGTLVSGVAASGVSVQVPYTGGNGGPHLGQSVNSTGVPGLTATLDAGDFGGSVTYVISGTPVTAPDTSGTASFALNIGGRSCTLELEVIGGRISFLNCANATPDTLTVSNGAVNGSVQVPYTGGNGGPHLGQTVSSTGVTGLTATLASGAFAIGTGNLTYAVTGTPNTTGTASFALDIGGRNCTLEVVIVIPASSGCWAKVGPTDTLYFMCHNLGSANTSANPLSPSWEINGGYRQWGRFGQAAPGPSGPGSSEANEGSISGWNTTNAPNGSWQDGTKTGNDPCPNGYRVPTKAQWDAVLANNAQSIVGTWTTYTNFHTNYTAGRFFGPALMLPAAGGRGSYDGALFYRGSSGLYWSSTENGSDFAWGLYFDSGTATTLSLYRRDGYSVRCAAE
jgi:uncharacterized protein (TIGR02145 family)